jgi:Transposase
LGWNPRFVGAPGLWPGAESFIGWAEHSAGAPCHTGFIHHRPVAQGTTVSLRKSCHVRENKYRFGRACPFSRRMCHRRGHGGSIQAAADPGLRGDPGLDPVLPGPVKAVYEAGPTGFGLARLLLASGIDCVVAAPSKLQRPSGNRVKTDANDALHLARLLRLDEITVVVIPTVEQEAARDLVRAREDARGDLMSARHRISKLLPRQGIIYTGGKAWTLQHEACLDRRLPRPASVRVFHLPVTLPWP